MSEYGKGMVAGMGVISLILFLMITLYTTITIPAQREEGRKEMWRDAFANGLAVKEIDKDDKVIYRWRELHGIGYESE